MMNGFLLLGMNDVGIELMQSEILFADFFVGMYACQGKEDRHSM